MTERRCPTGHRHITEDGVRIERDGPKRWAWVLATCRDCGQRLEQRWELSRRHSFGWQPVAAERESA